MKTLIEICETHWDKVTPEQIYEAAQAGSITIRNGGISQPELDMLLGKEANSEPVQEKSLLDSARELFLAAYDQKDWHRALAEGEQYVAELKKSSAPAPVQIKVLARMGRAAFTLYDKWRENAYAGACENYFGDLVALVKSVPVMVDNLESVHLAMDAVVAYSHLSHVAELQQDFQAVEKAVEEELKIIESISKSPHISPEVLTERRAYAYKRLGLAKVRLLGIDKNVLPLAKSKDADLLSDLREANNAYRLAYQYFCTLRGRAIAGNRNRLDKELIFTLDELITVEKVIGQLQGKNLQNDAFVGYFQSIAAYSYDLVCNNDCVEINIRRLRGLLPILIRFGPAKERGMYQATLDNLWR